jgi:hypothetical protein
MGAPPAGDALDYSPVGRERSRLSPHRIDRATPLTDTLEVFKLLARSGERRASHGTVAISYEFLDFSWICRAGPDYSFPPLY